MNKYSTKSAQGGFTLIELIVVIVILGILAATALPKFASLGADARASTLQAAKGSINSAAAMYHGKWLIDPKVNSVTIEGVAVPITNGYPDAGVLFATAAGVNAEDYDVIAAGATITISPKNIPVATRATCNLKYTDALANAAPVVLLTTTDCE